MRSKIKDRLLIFVTLIAILGTFLAVKSGSSSSIANAETETVEPPAAAEFVDQLKRVEDLQGVVPTLGSSATSEASKPSDLPGDQPSEITTATSGATQASPAPRAGDWDNTVSAPSLESPQVITLSDASATSFLPDNDRVGCDGKIYAIDIPSGKDAKIVMAADSGPLPYPVTVTGGRNVRIVGLDMDLTVQKGCDIGQATQRDNKSPNLNPRIPGSRAMRLEQAGTTFIEGVNIDLNGMEADCFVLRTPGDDTNKSQTLAQQKNRKFHVVNSRCEGYSGYDVNDDFGKDGIHGDLYQNQGKDAPSELVFENVVVRGGANGITSHGWYGQKLSLFKLRNFEYAHDERILANKVKKTYGLIFTTNVKSIGAVQLDNVYVNDSRGSKLNYGFITAEGQKLQRYGTQAGGQVKKIGGMLNGPSPRDMAPESQIGRNYVSPF